MFPASFSQFVYFSEWPRRLAAGDGICYIIFMSPSTKTILEKVASWPIEDQEELAELAREIEARRSGVYHATPEELQAIDDALGQVARGEVASKTEIEAAFAKFRGA